MIEHRSQHHLRDQCYHDSACDCLDLHHNHLGCISAGTQMALQSCKRPTIALFMFHLTSTTGYHGDGYDISIEDRLLLIEKYCYHDENHVWCMGYF